MSFDVSVGTHPRYSKLSKATNRRTVRRFSDPITSVNKHQLLKSIREIRLYIYDFIIFMIFFMTKKGLAPKTEKTKN